MKDYIWKLSIKVQSLLSSDEGQDLIEYALIVGMIAFAAIAGMKGVANGISNAFNNIATKLTTYTS